MITRKKQVHLILSEDGSESEQAKSFCKANTGTLLESGIIWAVGIDIAPLDSRRCVFFPYYQEIRIYGTSSYGITLSKSEYRKLLADIKDGIMPPWLYPPPFCWMDEQEYWLGEKAWYGKNKTSNTP